MTRITLLTAWPIASQLEGARGREIANTNRFGMVVVPPTNQLAATWHMVTADLGRRRLEMRWKTH